MVPPLRPADGSVFARAPTARRLVYSPRMLRPLVLLLAGTLGEGVNMSLIATPLDRAQFVPPPPDRVPALLADLPDLGVPAGAVVSDIEVGRATR